MSSSEATFRSALRREVPYLVDALASRCRFLDNRPQLDFLADLIADWHRAGQAPQSYLVPGCDRGIDAYSLCLVLFELSRTLPDLPFSILGTDFLPANQEQAVRGVYPATLVDHLPRAMIHRYFLRGRGTRMQEVRLMPGVRARIRFRCQDIFDSFRLREPMDVIFCRQILQHLHPALAQALAAKLRASLTPGGILILGAPLHRPHDGLQHLGQAIYMAV